MTLSLCMVVKNEASFIRSCLDSALAIVDEAVVVDTGSTDGTPAIARDLGARVYEVAWPGDLGSAHNLPLQHARGDWILVLDGDEVLDPTANRVIPMLCERGGADAFEFTFRNYFFQPQTNWKPCDPLDPLTRGALGWVPSYSVRLFRNDPRYRHEGHVHQRIIGSVRATGGRIDRCEMPIHHYGMVRCDRDKTPFYVALTRRQAAAAGNSQSWLELGIALTHTEERAEARRAFTLARDLGHPVEGSFNLGRIEAEAGNTQAAIEQFQRALAALEADETVTVHRADILEELGRGLDAVGRREEAVPVFRRALETRADSPVAMTELARLFIEEGNVDEANGLVERLLGRYRGLESTWITVGNLDLAQGNPEGAAHAFEIALDIAPKSVAARMNVAIAYARAGRKAAAARALAAARQLSKGEALAPGIPLPAVPFDRVVRVEIASRARPTIASITDHLYGGSGLVLTEVVEALTPDYRHVVLVEDRGEVGGMGLLESMERLGVDVRSMAWGADLSRQLDGLAPDVVVLHWWGGRGAATPGTMRVAEEPWVCVGHAPLPMPSGFDAYVVLSDFQQQSQAHLPAERVTRIPNGVDLDRFSTEGNRAQVRVTLAMLSRLDPEKFPRRLLHYLPPLEEMGAQLVVAGRGRRRWEIEPDLESTALTNAVRFVGPIRSDQVPTFLSDADIGLHLTETAEETMSKAVLEMLAAGLPIVSQPRGCLPQLVRTGENGFLSEAETEVARDLARLIGSARLRREMGVRSRERAHQYRMAAFRHRWQRLAGTLIRGTRDEPAGDPPWPDIVSDGREPDRPVR